MASVLIAMVTEEQIQDVAPPDPTRMVIFPDRPDPKDMVPMTTTPPPIREQVPGAARIRLNRRNQQGQQERRTIHLLPVKLTADLPIAHPRREAMEAGQEVALAVAAAVVAAAVAQDQAEQEEANYLFI
jgi:hypothetical protein